MQKHVLNKLLPHAVADPENSAQGSVNMVVASLREALLRAAAQKGVTKLTLKVVTDLELLTLKSSKITAERNKKAWLG